VTVGGGFTIRGSELVLANKALVEVAPLSETAKFVGNVTEIDDGTTKETFLIVPTTDTTLFAGAVTTEPPPDGVNKIETFDGRIVPVGNPLPWIVTVVIPACPAEGVIEERDTGVVSANAPPTSRITEKSIVTSNRNFLKIFAVSRMGLLHKMNR